MKTKIKCFVRKEATMGYVIYLNENGTESRLTWEELEDKVKGKFSKIDKTICKNRFYKCSELKEIYLDENIEVVENSAFEKCSNLEKVVFNSSLKTIGSFAFASTGIKEIIIPEGTFLEEEAFYNCVELETVIMPRNIKMSIDAFGGCYNIKKILLTEDNEIVDELDEEFIQYLVEKRKR